MHNEYAVDPAAIGGSWEEFRYLIEKFGFDRGRIVSRFPNKWEKSVIAAAKAAGIRDIHLASMAQKLRASKRALLTDSGRTFMPGADWLTNALASHAALPFHAIISNVHRAEIGCIVSPADCDEEHALMQAPISRTISRTPDELSSALLPIVLAAKQIDLIDPYFDLRGINGDFVGPLAALVTKLEARAAQPKIFRIHFVTHGTRPPDHMVAASLKRLTEDWLPAGYSLELVEWSEIQGGEDFHDRFVLCDCGGLMIGAGLAAAPMGESAVVTLLDTGLAEQLRSRFADGAQIYNKVGRTVRILAGLDGQVI